MRRAILAIAVLAFATLPRAAWGQWGGMGGRGGRPGGEQLGRGGSQAPRMPGSELEGPPDSATAQQLLSLSDQQAQQYRQVYDSFMVATRPQRDSVRAAAEKMNDRLDSGDRAAALFYAQRIQELGKYLKARQEKFEGNLHHFLSGDQVKSYRQWQEGQERAAEERNREAALRWRQGSFGGGGERLGSIREPKTVVASPPGVPYPDLGSQAVRVGRTVYISSQLPLDYAGALVGEGDLRAQAARAFANLAAVLRAAGGSIQDVVALTIYVVDYRPAQLATIREAGAGYFGTNAPITTLLGVQSLSRERALIAVAATAVTGTSGFAGGPMQDR